jgi:hypothetical protein
MRFFYGPYNGFFNMQRHMVFQDHQSSLSKRENWDKIKQQIYDRDTQLATYFQETVNKAVDQ